MISTAFKLLQGAKVFTKLDLCNAYHLVCIKVLKQRNVSSMYPQCHF